jgi:hypothetical protein
MAIQGKQGVWWKGHVDPIWKDTGYESLMWTNEPFNDPAMLKKWTDIGHVYQKYTGLMYDQRNVMPEWVHKLEEHLKHEWPSNPTNYGISVYCMKPGTILPNHYDAYVKYKQLHNITDNSKIYRMLFLMEDWKSGHYLEVDGVPFTNWKAGDYVAWKNDTLHLAANIGSEDRYTLQVTVTLDDSK